MYAIVYRLHNLRSGKVRVSVHGPLQMGDKVGINFLEKIYDLSERKESKTFCSIFEYFTTN